MTYQRLLETFHTPEAVFQASTEALQRVEGMRPKTAEGIARFSDHRGVEQELDRVEQQGLTLVPLNDGRYPRLLKTIYDPPPFLYVKGDLQEKDERGLALVGSRSASSYGKEMTARLARALAEQGFTVVSGLARGIDTAAHQGALRGGGRTIAVLGSGLDVIYPWENAPLAEAIAAQGAVISELPLGTLPEAPHFPARNRIISGLSLGTVIVEASFRSGSLITARLALEQGREVFAVPGNVDSPWSRGANRLIKEGAKLVMSAGDILEELLPQYQTPVREAPRADAAACGLSPEGTRLLGLLESNPLHIDALIRQSGLPSAQVSSLLLDLELKGLAQQLSGKMFKKVLAPQEQ